MDCELDGGVRCGDDESAGWGMGVFVAAARSICDRDLDFARASSSVEDNPCAWIGSDRRRQVSIASTTKVYARRIAHLEDVDPAWRESREVVTLDM